MSFLRSDIETQSFMRHVPEGAVAKTWPTSVLTPDVEEGDYVAKAGFVFKWTKEHLTGQQLEPLRLIGDPLADAALEEMKLQPSEDALDVLLQKGQSTDFPACQALLKQITTVPDWVDWEKIRRGQRLFYRHSTGAGQSLLHLSLVGGFGASKVNKVLTATGYLANANTYRRLWETTQMILDCMDEGAMAPRSGAGWASTVRVRFLHTRVRSRLRSPSMHWRTEEWGVPINQEDMCGTVLSFQFNVIFSLELAGIQLSDDDREDYTHLWRYIGYIIGLLEENNVFTCYSRTKAFADSLVMHLIDPDDTSIFLSQHVVRSLANRPPNRWTYECHAELARLYMGDYLADQLKFPPSSTYYRNFHLFGFAFQRFIDRLSKLHPLVDDALISVQRFILLYFLKKSLAGKPATFSLSHAPQKEQIGNAEHFQKINRYDHAGKGSPTALLLLLGVLLVLFKFLPKTGAVRSALGI